MIPILIKLLGESKLEFKNCTILLAKKLNQSMGNSTLLESMKEIDRTELSKLRETLNSR